MTNNVPGPEELTYRKTTYFQHEMTEVRAPSLLHAVEACVCVRASLRQGPNKLSFFVPSTESTSVISAAFRASCHEEHVHQLTSRCGILLVILLPALRSHRGVSKAIRLIVA